MAGLTQVDSLTFQQCVECPDTMQNTALETSAVLRKWPMAHSEGKQRKPLSSVFVRVFAQNDHAEQIIIGNIFHVHGANKFTVFHDAGAVA